MGVVNELFNFVNMRPPYCQVVIGTATGCLTSFIVMRFFKLAAALAGGAILLIKVAEIEELVYIDWDRTRRNVKSITPPPNTNDFDRIAEWPDHFKLSFVGGLLLGVGCF